MAKRKLWWQCLYCQTKNTIAEWRCRGCHRDRNWHWGLYPLRRELPK